MSRPSSPTTTARAALRLAPLSLGLLLAAAGPVRAQDAADPILGEPLKVDGEVIPLARIKRAVVTGAAGTMEVEMAKLRTLIRQEIAKRIEEGADPTTFRVSADEVQSAIEEQNAELRAEYGDDDVSLTQFVDGGLESLSSQVELTKFFNKTFLPMIDPEEYPATTIAALKSTETGSTILDQLKQEWERNRANAKQERRNPMYQQILFNMIYEYLQDTSNIVTGDSLPVGVVMRINGEDIATQDIWAKIKDNVDQGDVLRAKQWLLNMHLLRKDLADVWLDDEAAAQAYEEHAKPYDESMFTMKNFAMGVKKFPNMDYYRDFRRAYDSYQRRIQDELTPENLQKFAETRTRQLVGKTKVDADVILLSAFDFKERVWKPNGWRDATQKARRVMELLNEEGANWDEILEEHSEFYDPPIPADYKGSTAFMKFKGRFRNVGRNELMQKLDESEFAQFLNGTTLADIIFFDMKEGALGQPHRGRYGWYIPLLRKRNVVPLVTSNEEMVINLAEQDYTIVKLSQHVQDLIEKSEVSGLGL